MTYEQARELADLIDDLIESKIKYATRTNKDEDVQLIANEVQNARNALVRGLRDVETLEAL